MSDKSRRVHEAALGWLEIEISGEFTERLLNLALQQGVELREIRRLSRHRLRCRLLLREIYNLRPLLTSTRCRLRVLKRGGRPFWLYRARRRLGLIAGSILFCLALYIMCGFVWRVEVESVYPLEAAGRERVLLLAEEAGLRPGAWAPGLDLAVVSNYILTEASDLIFVYSERQGVTALIHIVRRVDAPGKGPQENPGDIIATMDGLIEQILVRNGSGAVEPGSTVKAGDVLVYGYGGGQLVAADALIEARVWGQAESEWPLVERGLRPSGQKDSGLWLRFPAATDSQPLLLGGKSASPYAQSVHKAQVYKPLLWRNMPLPVELISDVWYEQEPYATSYSREQAYSHAERQAAGLALAQLPGDCDLVSQTTIELDGGENAVCLRVICEATANIGSFAPLDDIRRAMYGQMLAQMQESTQ